MVHLSSVLAFSCSMNLSSNSALACLYFFPFFVCVTFMYTPPLLWNVIFHSLLNPSIFPPNVMMYSKSAPYSLPWKLTVAAFHVCLSCFSIHPSVADHCISPGFSKK